MRCPKCSTETPNEALCCPGCKLPTPRGTIYKKTRGKPSTPPPVAGPRKPAKKKEKRSINPLLALPAVLLAILLCGVGSYVGLTFWDEAQADDPGSLQSVIEKVQALPSSQAGKTIEEYLQHQVEMSSQAGRLAETEGWDARPIEGNQFLASFTFEEKGDLQHRAEWEVNLVKNTITARNELAAKAYKRD